MVVIDQRGHGRSDAPDAGYGMDTAVADLLKLIEVLELDRPVLAGQSWGGNVVLELGWRRPDAVRGIACVDGGVIELSQAYPTWEDCLAALTPPALDHLTLAELETRIRTSVPRLHRSRGRRAPAVLPHRAPTGRSSHDCSGAVISRSCVRSGSIVPPTR